jgi:spoIIIJ-associated protein
MSDPASETLTKGKALLTELLGKMGVEGNVVAREDGERVTLEVTGAETALVIGKKGATLDALQYLVNKICSQGTPEGSGKPIQVDAEGYRDRRAETLVELANKLAEKVRRTGRPVEMDPMSPGERRVVHVALAEQPDLETRSEGEGIYRHLVIFPRGPKGSKDPASATRDAE